jgi:hypothetical protein
MIPPFAFILNPKPTTKYVMLETLSTKRVFKRITVFLIILMEPTSFIMKPTYANITMTVQMTIQTVSRIESRLSNL